MANWKLKFFGAMVAVTVLFSGTAQAQIFETIETASFTAKAVGNLDAGYVMQISSTIPVTDTTPYLKTLPGVRGWLWRMFTDPGSTAPTADYDIYLVDGQSGLDLLNGSGVNRSTSASEQAFPLRGTGQWEPVYITGPTYFSLVGNAQDGALLETFLYILKDAP